MNVSQHNPLLCNAENSVLVIIDIQTRLCSAMPANVLSRVKRNSGILLVSAEKLGIPVMATEQYPKGLGTLDADLMELLPEDSKRYAKTCFSCTGSDDFPDHLNQIGRNQIILTGMESHVCVCCRRPWI